jgi:hypothetical protein
MNDCPIKGNLPNPFLWAFPHPEQYSVEDLKFAEDWTDLMVKNQWLEQPPKATDRKKLSDS